MNDVWMMYGELMTVIVIIIIIIIIIIIHTSTMWTKWKGFGVNPAVYRVSQKECARLREIVPYVKVHRYNPKHLYPKLNGYGDNGERSLKAWQLLYTYWLSNTY